MPAPPRAQVIDFMRRHFAYYDPLSWQLEKEEKELWWEGTKQRLAHLREWLRVSRPSPSRARGATDARDHCTPHERSARCASRDAQEERDDKSDHEMCPQELNLSEWQDVVYERAPKQTNAYDCGVFLCVTAEYLAHDGDLTSMKQEHMVDWRRRIVYRIVNFRPE